MLKLMMVAAVIAVGFFSMKSCDSSVSMQNQQMLMHKQEIENKLNQSETQTYNKLDPGKELMRQQREP